MAGHAAELPDQLLAILGVTLNGCVWAFWLFADRKEELRDRVHFDGIAFGRALVVGEAPEPGHVCVRSERDRIGEPLADPVLVRFAGDFVEARAGLAECADWDVHILADGEGNFLWKDGELAV